MTAEPTIRTSRDDQAVDRPLVIRVSATQLPRSDLSSSSKLQAFAEACSCSEALVIVNFQSTLRFQVLRSSGAAVCCYHQRRRMRRRTAVILYRKIHLPCCLGAPIFRYNGRGGGVWPLEKCHLVASSRVTVVGLNAVTHAVNLTRLVVLFFIRFSSLLLHRQAK